MKSFIEIFRKFWPVIVVVVGLIVAFVFWLARIKMATMRSDKKTDFRGGSSLPRGMRNNNPGNLVLTYIPWKGKVPNYDNTDGRFEQFTDYHWGIRAMIKDIQSDIRSGKNTIRKLITEYAPAHENNTASYISNLSQQTGIGPDEVISPSKSTMRPVVMEIARIENGRDAISKNQFDYAWTLL
jgi:flagellar biosynthesis/type III secretory pathway M-ring protein FliF/YscJ